MKNNMDKIDSLGKFIVTIIHPQPDSTATKLEGCLRDVTDLFLGSSFVMAHKELWALIMECPGVSELIPVDKQNDVQKSRVLFLEAGYLDAETIMSPDKFELVVRIEEVQKELDVIREVGFKAVLVNADLRKQIEEAKKILENLNKNGVWATPARVNTLGREALKELALDFEKSVDCLREALK